MAFCLYNRLCMIIKGIFSSHFYMVVYSGIEWGEVENRWFKMGSKYSNILITNNKNKLELI